MIGPVTVVAGRGHGELAELLGERHLADQPVDSSSWSTTVLRRTPHAKDSIIAELFRS